KVSIAIISVLLLFLVSGRHPRVARVSCINRKFHVNPTGKSLNARRHEVHQVAPSRLPTILRYRKQQSIMDAGLYKSQHRIWHSQQSVTDNLTCPRLTVERGGLREFPAFLDEHFPTPWIYYVALLSLLANLVLPSNQTMELGRHSVTEGLSVLERNPCLFGERLRSTAVGPTMP